VTTKTHIVVKVGRNVPEPGSTPSNKIVALRSWAPNLLSYCWNLGLWLPELCSKVLNPDTSSAAILHSSLTTYLYYDYRCVLKFI